MSITTALSNAVSGLTATARQTEVVSDNIANALTPGFSRRDVELSSQVIDGSGRGVLVDGVRLAQDPGLTGARRRSDAETGAQTSLLSALGSLQDAFGLPGEGSALAARASAFEAALLGASNEPSSPATLNAVAESGSQYAQTLSTLSTETQRLRMDADAQIARQVAQVNDNLRSIERLNQEIRLRSYSGGDSAALIDQRQALIDKISSALPIRTSQREGGAVAIYTTGGAALLESRAATLEFTATPIITQDMTLASGGLSGISIDGRAVDIGDPADPGRLDGGSLGAAFTVRDYMMPDMATALDALAEDLVNRFQNSGADSTLGPGDAGLFTDDGAAYDGVSRDGLAGRLELNAAVDPVQGGELWRLRDGIGAAAQGPAGDGTILGALHVVATETRTADPALGIAIGGGIATLAAALTERVGAEHEAAETEQAYLRTMNTQLRESESAAIGVDTDVQLQRLLLLEQAYAANARVISAADTMLQRLLEI